MIASSTFRSDCGIPDRQGGGWVLTYPDAMQAAELRCDPMETA